MANIKGYLTDRKGNKLFLDNVFDAIFPVGRGFIDFTNTDYSNYLGFTWEQELVGLTPVGYKAGDSDFGTIGKTMGEKSHILTIYEIPSHSHNATYSKTVGTGWESYKTGSSTTKGVKNYLNAYTGGGQAHNNMQPSQVVAYWKRIA